MDPIDLDAGRLEAGRDYLQALRKLGLEPDGLLWAHDRDLEQFVLVLVTKFVDVAGPLDLSKTLFAAYNAAATPREIDPFIVRLHSPNQSIIRSLSEALQTKYRVQEIDEDGRPGAFVEDMRITLTVGPLVVQREWIYQFKQRKQANIDVSRRWHRFSDNVQHLAA